VSAGGTSSYVDLRDLPPLVSAAVRAARGAGFEASCLPEQGRLLQVLAGGAGPGAIGETGTGCGVGLAWLATAAHPQARLTSVERDPARAALAAQLFAGDQRVSVRCAGWAALAAAAPFDLLVLDGGGQGKGDEPPLDPAVWLRPGGVVVIDDFTPATTWPPVFGDTPDTARLYWLEHPALRTVELRVTPAAATLVGCRRLP